MEDKNLKKYKELEEEYFSTCPNWTYNWEIDSIVYCLTWDFEENQYIYSIDGKFVCNYKDIYDALDGIIINKKTLRQLILETNFDFDYIN